MSWNGVMATGFWIMVILYFGAQAIGAQAIAGKV
jgi:hypothetical protein